MYDNIRIERLIREARVQRSAAIGAALGEFLGDLWLGTASLFGKAAASAPASTSRLEKSPAR